MKERAKMTPDEVERMPYFVNLKIAHGWKLYQFYRWDPSLHVAEK